MSLKSFNLLQTALYSTRKIPQTSRMQNRGKSRMEKEIQRKEQQLLEDLRKKLKNPLYNELETSNKKL